MAQPHAFDNRDAPLAGINVTPLVDVMLVLLVIFMITAPVLTTRWVQDHAPPVPPLRPLPEPVRLAIAADGAMRWNDRPIASAALAPSLRLEALRDPQPALHVSPSPDAPYQALVAVLGEARGAGLAQLAVVETR